MAAEELTVVPKVKKKKQQQKLKPGKSLIAAKKSTAEQESPKAVGWNS